MWTCVNCEQNNMDTADYCTLCGAEKPLPEVRASSAARMSRSAGSGAWENVGDWNRMMSASTAPKPPAAAPERPGPAARERPHTAASAWPNVTPDRPGPAPSPVAGMPVDESLAAPLQTLRKRVIWLRVGIVLLSVVLVLLLAKASNAVPLVWGDSLAIIIVLGAIVVPAFLPWHDTEESRRTEWWAGLLCAFVGSAMMLIVRSGSSGLTEGTSVVFWIRFWLLHYCIKCLNKGAEIEALLRERGEL